MESYKLYAAVLAIACIALQQEVGCNKQQQQQPVDVDSLEPSVEDDQTWSREEDSLEVEEPEQQQQLHHDCTEYKSRIWNEAFGNPATMALADLTLQTAKEMSADEVCSDTIRYVYLTAEKLTTDPDAQYVVRSFVKLLWSVAKKLDTGSNKFKETSKVIRTVMTDPAVQDLIASSFTRAVDLINDPVTRKRMFHMVKTMSVAFTPYLKKSIPAKNKRPSLFGR